MSTAIITFSKQGLIIAHKLKNIHTDWSIFIHNSILSCNGENRFEHIKDNIGTIFNTCNGIIFIGPCGIAVRSISPYIGHKTTDPAVVVVDAGGRFAMSLLSGHEGGANDLATETANIIGAEPCISTTTEAVKTITAGIGCRKGIPQETIISAIKEACALVNIKLEQIRTIATAQIKSSEQGLIDACKTLSIPLRILQDWQILRCNGDISKSEFVKETTGLPGVAEPAALISGRNTKLLLKKHIHKGVTVALAMEHCLWSE
jgi:cobalt-precorrin 5A hydrolase